MIDPGDTAFVLVSTALVLLMTPGLALFYGGLVRRRNVLATMMQSVALACVIGVQWVLCGYSIAFGPDVGHVTGSLAWAGLAGVGVEANADYAARVPHVAFAAFQGMFAIITPALISGAIAERTRFSGFLAFAVLWSTLIYDPIAHWVWGAGGFLRSLGALDFAGGTVVHLSAAASALAAILVIGPRRGFGRQPMPPHNLVLAITGAGILWFGWFGFNAGSALAANGVAAIALVTTQAGAAAGGCGWMALEWARKRKPTALGTVSGALAGLVAITPAAGFVTPLSALVIGAIAGAACQAIVDWRARTRLDDSLDVLGVHGAAGFLGAMLTGVFATKAVNPDGADGWIAGNLAQVGTQAIAVGATVAFAFVGSVVLLKVVDATIGLRATEEDEAVGLDASQHGEEGYVLGEAPTIAVGAGEMAMAMASERRIAAGAPRVGLPVPIESD